MEDINNLNFEDYDANRLRKPRIIKERIHHLDELDDSELIERYRFDRNSILELCDLVRAQLTHNTHRSESLSVENQVLIFLRFLATGSMQIVTGDTVNVSQPTVSRIVDRCLSAYMPLVNRFVSWPVEEVEIRKIQREFYDMYGIPNIIGLIDGTHIQIQAPSVDEDSFVNRLNYHSINTQIVCDSQGIITNFVAKWPGSVHDSTILNQSSLYTHMESGYHGQAIILGDAGYACKPWLLTPYRQCETPSKEGFNIAHKKTRCLVERCIGTLKRRWAVLHNEIRLSPLKTTKVISVCVMLHNIARRKNIQELDAVEIEEEFLDIPYAGHQNGGMRDHIADNYF